MPIILRAKNICHENATNVLNNTGKYAVVLWDNQYIDYQWYYNRKWNNYPKFEGVTIISMTKILQGLCLVCATGCVTGCVIYFTQS